MIVTGGVIAAGSGVTLLARLLGNAGLPVTRASLTSIGYAVTNLTAGVSLGVGTFAVAGSVYDALQVDPRWTFDSAAAPGPDGAFGFNFLATLAASLFPVSAPVAGAVPGQGGARVQADVVFTPLSGEPFRAIFAWSMGRVFG